jgi:hypothetical protein
MILRLLSLGTIAIMVVSLTFVEKPAAVTVMLLVIALANMLGVAVFLRDIGGNQ